jgi:hypothetical protein
VVGANVPSFGCLGTDAKRQVAACIIGIAGVGMGGIPTSVTIAFAPLAAGIEAPPSIVLLSDAADTVGSLEQRPLDPAVRARLRAALAEFIDWAPISELSMSAEHRFAAKGAEVHLRNATTSIGGENDPPRHDIALEVRMAGRAEIIDVQTSAPVSGYVVRIFHASDALVVERSISTAMEGAYQTQVDAWKCDVSRCESVF